MSRSGEKHAQDYNLILCILMALRATYFLSVIYGDPVAAIITRAEVGGELSAADWAIAGAGDGEGSRHHAPLSPRVYHCEIRGIISSGIKIQP